MARCHPLRRRARRRWRCARNRAGRSATCRSCRAPLARPCFGSYPACPGQPCPETLVERISIQEVCQRDVLRDETGGVDQNSLVIALATLLLARYQLVDLAVELLARELARLDHPLELTLQHVEIPTVDDDLVHLRPARRIELAARQRDEGAAWLEPKLAAHHVARSGAADGDIGATHDLFDRILGHDCNPERLRPFPRKRRPRLGPTRGTTDFLEPVHAAKTAQRIRR